MRIIFFLFTFLLFLLLYPIAYSPYPSFAQQSSTCQEGGINPRAAQGLVSAKGLISGSKFGNASSVCILDQKAAFASFKIPTYDDLKSIHYTQVKSSNLIEKHQTLSGDKTQAQIPFDGSTDHLYYIDGSLNLTGSVTGGKTGVVFVEKDLNIRGNFTYGTQLTGAVFIVKGNVNIDPSVSQIEAVLISEGVICTAYDFAVSLCPPGFTTPLPQSQRLVVNGSFISLDSTESIRFRRSLTNNHLLAAEVINHQPKYLVILKELLSYTYERWAEIP